MASVMSVGDIITSIRFAHEICVKCLREEYRANTRYQQLVDDIQQLDLQLKKLQVIFESAGQNHRRAPLPGVRRGDPPAQPMIDQVTLQERDVQSARIIGNFSKTLEECNAFMDRYSAYSTQRTGVYGAARWHVSGLDQQVQQLRTRIQFHCTKIAFCLTPLQLELLQHVAQTVETVEMISRRIYDIVSGQATAGTPQFPPVPTSLSACYEAQAQRADKRPFTSAEPYPLNESIDALLFHYDRSDIDGLHAQVRSSKHLNEFLKTQFILERITEHESFKRLEPLARTIVARVDERIQLQYGMLQSAWVEQHAAIIATWEDVYFRIWFQQDIPIPPPPAHVARVWEEKILQVELADDEENSKQLCVFRQSDTQFRLLETATNEPGTRYIINTHHWRLVPWYAVPNRPSSSRSFQLCHSSVDQGDIFAFRSDVDLFAFQQTLTGYHVKHNATQVQWFLQTKRRTQMVSRAVSGSETWSGIQIWEFSPLEDMDATTRESGPPTEARSSSEKSRAGTMATSLVAAMGPRRGSMMRTIVQKDPSIEAIAEMGPSDPVLVIFTQYEGSPSFLYIPLIPEIGCNRQRCACIDLKSECRIIVLEKHRRQRFAVRVHSVSNSEQWADWNLLLFAQPKPDRFHSLPLWKDVLELSLEFPSAEARKLFQRELFGAMSRRNECLSRQLPVGDMPRQDDTTTNVNGRLETILSNASTPYQGTVSSLSVEEGEYPWNNDTPWEDCLSVMETQSTTNSE